MRLLRFHPFSHERCSLYAPCRRADLEADWQAYKRRIEDAAERGDQAAIETDMQAVLDRRAARLGRYGI